MLSSLKSIRTGLYPENIENRAYSYVLSEFNNMPLSVCDNIDDEHYTMLAEDGSRYKCVMCRGEKEEVYDKHHKKYSLTLGEDDSNKENNE